jgi:hypothetical protein
MFRMIAEAKLEPVLTDLLYYFERDEARHVGLGVLTLPGVLEGLSDRDALALWWFQTRLQLEMIAGGMVINPAFAELGVDPAEMNLQGFRYHNEILRRMKHTRPGRGTDAKAIKGLFRMSRAGQDRFQELFFPSAPPPAWQRAFLGAMLTAARHTDAWLSRMRS